MELREAVREMHEKAENTELSKLMISGNMNLHVYAGFLANMQQIYQELERDQLITKPEVLRSKKITEDIAKLSMASKPIVWEATQYVTYLTQLAPIDRWAHIYVHYLGNMYGGQMIGKQLPGQHDHLLFDDLKACIGYVRANIANINHDEANRAFAWTIRLYDGIFDEFHESTA
jgi:heme oxygenase